MRTLAALVVAILSGACAYGPASDVHRESEDPLLAFHLTRDEQGSDLQSREFEGRRIHLERQPVISDPDILHVDAAFRDDGLILDVEFRRDAAERLQSTTADNIGRALAILFNSKIVSVPVIRGGIGGRAQTLVPATSSEEAQHFLKLIKTRWPLLPSTEAASTALQLDPDSLKAVAGLERVRTSYEAASGAWPRFELDQLVLVVGLQPGGPTFLLDGSAPPAEFRPIGTEPGIFVRPGPPPDSLSGLRLNMDWNGRQGVGTAISLHPGMLEYLPHMVIHEAFHTFQALENRKESSRFQQRPVPDFPTASPEPLALLNLEGRYLADALQAVGQDSGRAAARKALAVRAFRCSRLEGAECLAERGVEQNEGAATYVSAVAVGDVLGYGPDGVWQDSLARGLSPIRDMERLRRWHFYDTGHTWIRLIERFSPSGNWQERIAVSPPDQVLAEVLGVSTADSLTGPTSVLTGDRWREAQLAAETLLAQETARRDSLERAFFSRPGVPFRVYPGRIRSKRSEERQLADGRVERIVRFDANELLLRGPSREFCCPAGEMTIAPVRGAVASVNGEPVPLDRPGEAAGEVRLDLQSVALHFPNAELRVYADSVTVRASGSQD